MAVDKGVPIPRKRQGEYGIGFGTTQALRELLLAEVGDSVEVEMSSNGNVITTWLRVGGKSGDVTVRKIANRKYRVWKIK